MRFTRPTPAVPSAAKIDSSTSLSVAAFAVCAGANGALQDYLRRAETLIQLQQNLIEGQQAQMQKLRIDLAHARESKALLLTVLDDLGALRTMLRGV